MPWLRGQPIDQFVSERTSDPAALRSVALAFRAMMRRLGTAQIAHGDLHNGNLFVDEAGRLQLMDYDSMFVPGLEGRAGGENGHPDFEHPKYGFEAGAKRPYDAKMDHFSSHVIYLSLLAAAEPPEVWQRFHEDESLLFQGPRDLRNPDASELFKTLKESKHPEVALLAHKLADYAYLDPQHVPSLETSLQQIERLIAEHSVAQNPDEQALEPSPAAKAASPGGPLGSARPVTLRGFGARQPSP
jgi:hypothetical protein